MTMLCFKVQIITLLAVILIASGCVGRVGKSETCGVLLVRDGKHVIPSEVEYGKMETKLGLFLADHGLSLVRDLSRAQKVATVAYVPDPLKPGEGELVVRNISTNSYTPNRGAGRSREVSDVNASRDASTIGSALGHTTLREFPDPPPSSRVQ